MSWCVREGGRLALFKSPCYTVCGAYEKESSGEQRLAAAAAVVLGPPGAVSAKEGAAKGSGGFLGGGGLPLVGVVMVRRDVLRKGYWLGMGVFGTAERHRDRECG